MQMKFVGLVSLAVVGLSSLGCTRPPAEESAATPSTPESICQAAVAEKHSVAPDTITLQFGRTDEGGTAYAYTLDEGTRGTCRVLDDGTIEYVQTAEEAGAGEAMPQEMLETACREAVAEQYSVAPDTIELVFGRSDEGGSAFAYTLANGTQGTCRALDDGTIDYIQEAS
ncbi:MAG TPA: hypothetical protein V6D06_05135 [Trichocoleus sp.]